MASVTDGMATRKDALMPLGGMLGLTAAALHWISGLVIVIGLVTSSGSHSEEWNAKYPDWSDKMMVMGNMTHPDSAPMVMDRLERMYAVQGWLVLEGMLEAVACLAAICCIMSLKSQMNYRRPADEREMIMYACLLIGLLIPMLEFCMKAGPVSFVGWVAYEVRKTDGTGLFSNFSDTHIQMLWLAMSVTESLFNWLNTFADLLLGLGFVQLSFIGTARAKIIIDDKTRLVGFWTGGLFIAAFWFGLLRETSTIGGDAYYITFEIIVSAITACLGVFLVPIYFVCLGTGLARVASVEDLNTRLGDIASMVGAASASDVAEGQKALQAAQDAQTLNPVAEGTDGAGDDDDDTQKS